MEKRLYQTAGLDLQKIAIDLEAEYQQQGFVTQQISDGEQVLVQMKHENLLRHISGFDRVIGVSFQKTGEGTLVTVGGQKWADKVTAGVLGMFFAPLLVTAIAGAATEKNFVHHVLDSVDQYIRAQKPDMEMQTVKQ